MAKPKLALIPATQGSKLYSVLPANGVGDFDFSRNTIATRINSQGLIETVASGVSRLNYPLIDGVVNGCPSHLLEPQRLQKIQYSEAFDNAYWSKSNTNVVSGQLSPKGDTSAFKLLNSAVTSTHYLKKEPISVASGVDYTFSILAKKGENDFITVMLQGTGWLGSSKQVSFNLANGTFDYADTGLTYKSTLLSSGFYRIEVTNETASTSVNLRVYTSATVNNTSSYLGDGSSGVYIWGAQLEQGSYATSYIPNYGTSAGVTRSAETANGSGDASTFNDSEGVLMAELSGFKNDSNYRAISVSDGTDANRINIWIWNDGRLRADLTSASVEQAGVFLNYDMTSSTKIALKYKLNDFSVWVNGIEVYTFSISNTPIALNNISFYQGSVLYPFYGNTKQLQYFDSALNDTELEKLTSYTSFTAMANAQSYTII